MAKFDKNWLQNLANFAGKSRQQQVDEGLIEWNPSMLEPKKGGEPVLPAVGTGVRPAQMPKWAQGQLPELRQGYGERMKALAQAKALREAPTAPEGEAPKNG